MFNTAFPKAAAIALSAIAVLAATALADSNATAVVLGAGQSTSVSLAPATTSCNGAQLFTLNYPGDNTNVTIDAQLSGSGLNPINSAAVGFNVWDSTNTVAPIETANLLTNQKNSMPGMLEFNYSSGTAGLVTIELFNWAQVPVSGTVSVMAVRRVEPSARR